MKSYLSLPLYLGSWIAMAAPGELDLNAWRRRIEASNADFKALEMEERASVTQVLEAENLALSPYLFADASVTDTRKPQAMPDQMGRQTQSRSLSLGVGKQFSTGTQVKALWLQEYQNIIGLAFPYQAAWTGTWGVEVQQSLWKNMFGRQTRMQFERQDEAARLARLTSEIERQKKWAAAEVAYWNWVQRAAEREIRREDLKRSEELARWMKDQVRKGLSTPSDFLQVEALLMVRQIEVRTNEDEWKKAVDQMTELDPTFAKDMPQLPSEAQWRAAQTDRMAGKPRHSLAAQLLEAQAKVGALKSSESAENLKADLNLSAKFYGHRRDERLGESANPGWSQDRDTVILGLNFKMDLDRGAHSRLDGSFRIQAEAARLRANKAKGDGERAWTELVRSYRDLRDRSELAEKLWQVQIRKAQREKDLLGKGRSNTFQLVNFEKERSEAHVRWLQSLIGLRQTEAQALLFSVATTSKEG